MEIAKAEEGESNNCPKGKTEFSQERSNCHLAPSNGKSKTGEA